MHISGFSCHQGKPFRTRWTTFRGVYLTTKFDAIISKQSRGLLRVTDSSLWAGHLREDIFALKAAVAIRALFEEHSGIRQKMNVFVFLECRTVWHPISLLCKVFTPKNSNRTHTYDLPNRTRIERQSQSCYTLKRAGCFFDFLIVCLAFKHPISEMEIWRVVSSVAEV